VHVQFGRTGTLAWVDGTDFNTPVTGEAIIPAGQWVGNALVIPLVNEGQFGTSKSFTVEIAGTTSPITISPGTATATILGGTVPPDCSFTPLRRYLPDRLLNPLAFWAVPGPAVPRESSSRRAER
jgi:hypothetical protein